MKKTMLENLKGLSNWFRGHYNRLVNFFLNRYYKMESGYNILNR